MGLGHGIPPAPAGRRSCPVVQRTSADRHPLAPIVDSWQELAPSAVALDVRPRAILLPAPWRDLDRDHGRLPLDLDRAPLAPEPRTEAGSCPDWNRPAPASFGLAGEERP